MTVHTEVTSLYDFVPWCGAVPTYNRLIEEGYAEEFIEVLEELNPQGMSDTDLNDILWFNTEWIKETFPKVKGITE